MQSIICNLPRGPQYDKHCNKAISTLGIIRMGKISLSNFQRVLWE